MNYYFVSVATDRILDVLYCCPGRDATASEVEAVARPLANEAHGAVYVLKGEHTGLTFAPCLGYAEDVGRK